MDGVGGHGEVLNRSFYNSGGDCAPRDNGNYLLKREEEGLLRLLYLNREGESRN